MEKDVIKISTVLTRIFQSAILPLNTTLMVALHDFATSERISYNGNINIHPASVIKTLYMLAYLQEVKEGKRDLNEIYTLQEEDFFGSPGSKVDGSGILQFKEPGLQYTWGELMGLMISISDNLATNLFMEALGKDTLNAKIREYGLKDSRIVRKIKQMIPGNNHSNADDMVQVLVALESRKFIDGELYEFAVGVMKKTINKARIGRYLPQEIIVANKTGSLDNVIGDSALLFFPQRKPLGLTIFIHGNNRAHVSENEAEECIGTVAKQVVDLYYN